MRHRLKTFLTRALMCAPVFFFAVPNLLFSQAKALRIDSLLTAYHSCDQFNGAALVAENGKVICKKGFGYADMEWRIPNAPDTKFRIASLTKQFTAMLVLQQVEKGRIRLDGKITDYLPDYPPRTGDYITIHQLLSHTSGMPHYGAIPDFFPKYSRQPYAPDEYIKLFRNLDLLSEPGTEYSYSSFGYYLLGVILEHVTGKSYGKLLQERIFNTLGMKDTRLDDHETLENNRATGYRYTLSGYQNASFRDMSTAYSTGALFSTVEDLYLWDQALYTEKLLSDEYKELLFTPNLSGYGYGWNVEKIPASGTDSATAVEHQGDTNGFTACITRILDDKHLIVLLRNTRNNPGPGLERISRDISAILYGSRYEGARKSIAAALLKALENKGPVRIVELYHSLKNDYPGAYFFGENELNALGYHLIELDRVREAIMIFRLNVEAYPEVFSVYNSLGEALLINEEKELAAKNLEKSLELNPGNPMAVEMLRKINADKSGGQTGQTK
jgi:CubicO group peptidase (beta-lactamase class C family)